MTDFHRFAMGVSEKGRSSILPSHFLRPKSLSSVSFRQDLMFCMWRAFFDKAAKCNQYCALELVFIPKVSLYLWSFWCIALVVFSNVDLPTVAQTSLFAQDSTSSISCLIRVLEQVKRSVITGRLRPQLFEVGCKFYIAFRSVHFGVFHTCVWGLDSHVLPFLFVFARWHAQSSHVPTSHRD